MALYSSVNQISKYSGQISTMAGKTAIKVEDIKREGVYTRQGRDNISQLLCLLPSQNS